MNRYISLSVLIMGVALTGCSAKKEKPVTQTELYQIETEVKTETEAETDVTLPSKSEIQASVLRRGKEGSFEYQISTSSVVEGIGTYKTDIDGVQLFTDTMEFYSTVENTVIVMNEKSTVLDDKFIDIWSLMYRENALLKDVVQINEKDCYLVTSDYDTTCSLFSGICIKEGYSDVITGPIHCDFYISCDLHEFVRADIRTNFLANKNGVDEKGELFISLKVDNTHADKITVPSEYLEQPDSYIAGTIDDSNNSYLNEYFDLQIIGEELFVFDPDETERISDSYKASKSSYEEEAYGAGTNYIINIASIRNDDSSKESLLEKYLKDSTASEIESANTIQIGKNSYICKKAVINGTDTKTYCTDVQDRFLFITVYHKKKISRVEKNFFSSTDNPFWNKESWILEGKYNVNTPYGYSIIKNESNELYVCMSSSINKVNIFAIENSNIETEIEVETVNTGKTVREIREQSQEKISDGIVLSYYKIFNKDQDYQYYTHIGLMQVDTAVIKFHEVTTDDTSDYKDIFKEFAREVSVKEISTEAETEG